MAKRTREILAAVAPAAEAAAAGTTAPTNLEMWQLYSEQFRAIDDDLDDLVRRAENFAQADQIIKSWELANLNYVRARNIIFSDHLGAIRDLVREFQEAQASIEQALDDLQHDAATIALAGNLISTGVKKGKELLDAV